MKAIYWQPGEYCRAGARLMHYYDAWDTRQLESFLLRMGMVAAHATNVQLVGARGA